MISLDSDTTDSKGRSAGSGWVFFDRDCRLCRSLARRFRRILARRGFGLAALQDPRVAAHLGLDRDALLREMRILTTDGTVHGGADAVIFLAGRIWWAWPLYAAAQLPGARNILRAGYRKFAAHRHCLSAQCSLPQNDRRDDFLSSAKGAPK